MMFSTMDYSTRQDIIYAHPFYRLMALRPSFNLEWPFFLPLKLDFFDGVLEKKNSSTTIKIFPSTYHTLGEVCFSSLERRIFEI